MEIQEKYSAVGDQTACCYMFVEGDPAPTFKFYKVTGLQKNLPWKNLFVKLKRGWGGLLNMGEGGTVAMVGG